MEFTIVTDEVFQGGILTNLKVIAYRLIGHFSRLFLNCSNKSFRAFNSFSRFSLCFLDLWLVLDSKILISSFNLTISLAISLTLFFFIFINCSEAYGIPNSTRLFTTLNSFDTYKFENIVKFLASALLGKFVSELTSIICKKKIIFTGHLNNKILT